MCTVCDKGAEPEWLTRYEASEYIGRNVETLRRAVRNGELQKYKRGGRVLFRRDELDEWHKPKPA
jgi:excisionase family DNA binding protein